MQTKQKLWISLGLAILLLPASGFSFQAQFGLAPDNSGSLLPSALKSAKKKILMNIYEFESKTIADVLTDQIRAGVSVEILIEGEPVTPISAEESKIIKQIQDAMKKAGGNQNHLYLMTHPEKAIKRRFRWDHAKYLVLDSRAVLVASENFSEGGHPQAGKIGNRGWETLLNSPTLAQQLSDVFHSDADPSQGDITELKPNDPLPLGTGSSQTAAPRPLPALPVGSGEVSQARLITSPNSTQPIAELIQSAQDQGPPPSPQ